MSRFAGVVGTAEGTTGRRLFVGALAIALLVIGAFIAVTGTDPDIQNLQSTAVQLVHHPLSVYASQHGPHYAYPYPPGFFPVAVVEHELATHLHVSFEHIHRAFIALVYLAVALLLYALAVARRGPAEGALVAAAFAVTPLVVAEVGTHGQLDILSAGLCLAALAYWQHGEGTRRVVVVTVLIGLAAAVKPPPAVVALAFVFAIPTVRQRVAFIAGVVGIPLLLLLPYLVDDAGAVTRVLRYQGLPGLSGLSLLVQPRLAKGWLEGSPVQLSSAVSSLRSGSTALVVAAILIGAFTIWRLRPSVELGAVYALLPVYALGVAETPYDLLWVLPFLCLVLRTRWLVALSVVTAVPALLLYLPLARGTFASAASPWSGAAPVTAYVLVMDALWLAAAAWTLVNLVRAARPRAAVQPAVAAAT